MLISRKTYNQLIKERDKAIKERDEAVLSERKAWTMENILKRLDDRIGFTCSSGIISRSGVGFTSLQVDENLIPVFVTDYLTKEKIIKQTSTKLIAISPNGEVSHHFTSTRPDKGYSYKLVRLSK